MEVARQGRSPEKGILADFLGDFTQSAKLGLPIYQIEGQSGFVWITSFNDQGRGWLRSFAINVTALTAGRESNVEQAKQKQLPDAKEAASRAEQERKDREAAEIRRVEQMLDDCGQ
jgi:hypothetical protein